MSKDFKAGERVRVFGYDELEKWVIGGTVHGVDGDRLWVRTDGNGCLFCAHPKQCRRLRKKKPEIYWVRRCSKDNDCHEAVRTSMAREICEGCQVFRVRRLKGDV